MAHRISYSLLGALAAALFVGGCAQQKPMTMEEALSPAPGQAIPVPPGARLIAFGHYPVAPFVLPPEGGMVYVYDMDADRVVFVNHYPAGNSSGAGDLSQLSKSSFDTAHSYRVYYLPQAMPAASQP